MRKRIVVEMKHNRYFVVPRKNGWNILHEGSRHGIFKTPARGIAAAIDIAQKSGSRSLVFVQKDVQAQAITEGDPNAYQLVWTSEEDS